MKKILLCCDYYLPSVKAGGPLRAIAAIIEALKNTADVTVVTRNHDLCVAEPYSNIESDTLIQKEGYQILYLSDKNIFSGLYNLVIKNNFDVIYVNSFFSPKFSIFPTLLSFFKKNKNIRRIISPRGELGFGSLSIKPFRKKLFLFLFKRIVYFKNIELLVSSQNEENEVKNLIGKNLKIKMLSDIPSNQKIDKVVNEKKEKNIKMVFLSRISRKKNLHYGLELLSSLSGEIQFDIYGLIEDKTYWADCLKIIEKLPSNCQVNYRGECDPEKVLNILKYYDLFFLPTLNENYGYAIVEALAAACPVLLSNQTPWHDLSQFDAGWECELSQPIQFVQKINSLVEMKAEQYQHYKEAALNYYVDHVVNNLLIDDYQHFLLNSTEAPALAGGVKI
ncbi:MAG: glycosyltransferase family 4 protein [Gammaproteobacteria bacterium]|nr:glycosyltransferase family 4 protein [Gammaproteobacteria bacterium]